VVAAEGGAATVVEVVEAAVAAVAVAAGVVMEAVAVGVIDRSILPHGQGASQRGFLIDLPHHCSPGLAGRSVLTMPVPACVVPSFLSALSLLG
jgi:hypothetical protein